MSINERHLNVPRKSPLLSVIIPVYNAGEYLRESVESVLSQDLKDMEILLVDDCSTDSSSKICRELAAKDQRIKFFPMPENRGPGVARNIALDYADGDYCTFLDADDLLAPDAYSTMVAFAKRHDLDIVRCEVGRFTDTDRTPKHIFHHYREETIFRDPADLRQAALCVFSDPVRSGEKNLNFGGSAWGAIFHRSLFEQGGVRFPRRPHMLSEDFVFCFQTLVKARSLGLIPRMLHYYRFNQQGRTMVPRTDMLDRAFPAAEMMDELIVREGYPEKDRTYALGFVLEITRSFIKNILLSPMPLKEKKKWFDAQHSHPILERCAKDYPLDLLPAKFRIHFEAFYNKRFWTLMGLIRTREVIRFVTRK